MPGLDLDPLDPDYEDRLRAIANAGIRALLADYNQAAEWALLAMLEADAAAFGGTLWDDPDSL